MSVLAHVVLNGLLQSEPKSKIVRLKEAIGRSGLQGEARKAASKPCRPDRLNKACETTPIRTRWNSR